MKILLKNAREQKGLKTREVAQLLKIDQALILGAVHRLRCLSPPQSRSRRLMTMKMPTIWSFRSSERHRGQTEALKASGRSKDGIFRRTDWPCRFSGLTQWPSEQCDEAGPGRYLCVLPHHMTRTATFFLTPQEEVPCPISISCSKLSISANNVGLNAADCSSSGADSP